MTDTDTNDTLTFLQEKGDIYTKLSTTERKRLAELEEALDQVHEEINKYRYNRSTINVVLMLIYIYRV